MTDTDNHHDTPLPGEQGNIKPKRRHKGLTVLVIGIVMGAVLWGGFDATIKVTNREEFCISCHELRQTVYMEYLESSHNSNRTGIRATCSDCHVPREGFPKLIRKVQASNDVYHHFLGTIDTEEKFEARRLQLAERVWKRMKETDSRECRSCHDADAMDYVRQGYRSMSQHIHGLDSGETCIDCHKGIVHQLPHKIAHKMAQE
uniref:Cytochrome c-type protein n=1 Tax=Candidatus Kentrum sp. MB TaxID=2138164 RepID=A0A450XKM3_9GAMM|nr:MAG: periplasmic nitrate reductase subunit NapC [Candidatus Kentron sp. MB]VFK29880.1 MAG: periplasmic nitrate reductase subunit NapC [Candidatus Kentron sp. MB]VFK74981.1 MAG: periplasmic nitrate reductase subunit NapC [Candidatus Kentron sp. MB]